MTDGTPASGSDSYALGRSSAETDRLITQHQLYGPFTRQFLVAAGVTAGMKVLDLGSGAGDVALLLADLVGPQGRVVGVDTNEEILAVARDRVRAAGWTTVSFQAGTLADLTLDRDFDAVVGRWILMYLPDPAQFLQQARTFLRPGESSHFRKATSANPPAPIRPRSCMNSSRGWSRHLPARPAPTSTWVRSSFTPSSPPGWRHRSCGTIRPSAAGNSGPDSATSLTPSEISCPS